MDYADEAVIKWTSKHPRQKAGNFGDMLWGELVQMDWAEKGMEFELKGTIDPVEIHAKTIEDLIKKSQEDLSNVRSINIATMKDMASFRMPMKCQAQDEYLYEYKGRTKEIIDELNRVEKGRIDILNGEIQKTQKMNKKNRKQRSTIPTKKQKKKNFKFIQKGARALGLKSK